MNYLPMQVFKILSAGWRRRYIIMIPILALPIIGGYLGFTSKNKYVSHTSMLIQETAKMNPFLEDLAVSSMLKERTEALKTLLHSRHILGAVAQDLKLYNEDSSNHIKNQVIQSLAKSLSMQVIGKDLVRIELSSGDKETMKRTLEVVSKHFIDQLLAPERSSITDSTRFLEEHLIKREEELNQAELALTEFRSQFSSSLPERHSSNITRLNRMKQSLSEKESELAGAQRSVGGFDQLLSSTNPIVGRIEESIVSTRANLALARARYTDKHSKIQALLRSVDRLEKERLKAIKSTEHIVDAGQLWEIALNYSENGSKTQPLLISQLQNLQDAKNRVEALEEVVNHLKTSIASTTSDLEKFGRNESEIYKLERDLRVKRELYENLLERREMAEVMGSLGKFEYGKRIKIIDLPYIPSNSSNMPVMLFLLIGLIGGVFLGIGLAVVIELSDSSIRYRDQLEELTGLTVLGRIPPMIITVDKV